MVVIRTGAALRATTVLLLGESHPEELVRLSGDTGAADDTLRFLEEERSVRTLVWYICLNGRATYHGEDLDGLNKGAETGGVEGLKVEHLNTLEGTEDLKTLETGGLVDVGGDLAGLRALAVDFGGGMLRTTGSSGGDGAHSGGTDGLPEGGAGREGCGAEGGGEHGFWRTERTARGETTSGGRRSCCRDEPGHGCTWA